MLNIHHSSLLRPMGNHHGAAGEEPTAGPKDESQLPPLQRYAKARFLTGLCGMMGCGNGPWLRKHHGVGESMHTCCFKIGLNIFRYCNCLFFILVGLIQSYLDLR